VLNDSGDVMQVPVQTALEYLVAIGEPNLMECMAQVLMLQQTSLFLTCIV